MISEVEYRNNKEMLDWLKNELAKAQGSFDQSMKTLKKDHKCKTLEETKELIAKLEDEQRLYEEEYRENINKIKRKFKKKLKERKYA